MCKRLIHYIFVVIYCWIYTLPALAAAQLQATIDNEQVALGETFILNLDLFQASPQDVQSFNEPDISVLKGLFAIRGQQKFQSSQNTNGQLVNRVSWQYVLEPQQTGTLKIPPIALKTTSGTLLSQALTVTVSASQSRKDTEERLEAQVSYNTPYLYQPIYYTLRLYHQGTLQDPQFTPPTEGVIAEQLGRLSKRREVIDGQMTDIVEATFLLTPIRAGQLTLPAGQITWQKPTQRNTQLGGSFFGFTNYIPTTVASNSVTLDVKKPPVPQQPWLPLNMLRLEQRWEHDINQPVLVGVPLVRTLKLVAEGVGAQPLSPLEDLLPNSPDFRVRSPKPDNERKLMEDGKTPVNVVEQSFSVMPLREGTLTLPEIHIPWWNVQENQLRWATLPTQTIKVIPNPNQSYPGLASRPTVITTVAGLPGSLTTTQYTLLGLSALALLIALSNLWSLRRRNVIPRHRFWSHPLQKGLSEKQLVKTLATTTDLLSIKQLIQRYAHNHWGTPENAPLQVIMNAVHTQQSQNESFINALKALESAFYGGQPLDIALWRDTCCRALKQLQPKPINTNQTETIALPPLNPS